MIIAKIKYLNNQIWGCGVSYFWHALSGSPCNIIRWFVFFVLKDLHYTLFCEVLLLLISSSYFFFNFWTKAGVVPLSSSLFPLILLKENTVLKFLSSELRAILNGLLSCFQLLVKPISKIPIWLAVGWQWIRLVLSLDYGHDKTWLVVPVSGPFSFV